MLVRDACQVEAARSGGDGTRADEVLKAGMDILGLE
jgi:hypothetical protein